MQKSELTPFIFFLVLDSGLPKNYYLFDDILKELGYILVPVKIDQLQVLAAASSQDQLIVLSSVTDAREFKLYNEKVRGLLKYVLKSKRLTFIHLSSFAKLNDYKGFNLQRNYFFIKYPFNARALMERIVRFHELKQEQLTLWPGGKRSSAVGIT